MPWQTHHFRNLSYSELEAKQNVLAAEVHKDPQQAHLILAEPQPTFTGGKSAKEDGLLWADEERTQRGVAVFQASRGGQWTYHGPGQIVGYPIVQLRRLGFSNRAVSLFLETLAKALIAAINELGLQTKLGSPFGLYTNGSKLASFGIHVSRGVVTHGFSLNLAPVEDFTQGIVPCGVQCQPMTSLHQLGWQGEWKEAAQAIERSIKKGLEIKAEAL